MTWLTKDIKEEIGSIIVDDMEESHEGRILVEDQTPVKLVTQRDHI
jgi:hypothetical protein